MTIHVFNRPDCPVSVILEATKQVPIRTQDVAISLSQLHIRHRNPIHPPTE